MRSLLFHPRSSAFIRGGLLCGLLSGCSGYAGPRNVTNDDPAVKIPLVHRAVAAQDKSIIPQMLKDLDSDDAAIRFTAVEALQRLTGQEHDYDWTVQDRNARASAVARWRDAMGNPPLPHRDHRPATQHVKPD